MQSFIAKLGRLGFVWQFITLGGLHANALATATFAKSFKEKGMLGYVANVQRKERENNVDACSSIKSGRVLTMWTS